MTREVIAEARREQAVPWAIDLFGALADIEILAGDYPAAAAALDTAGLLLRSHGIESWARKLVYQRGRLALHRGDLDSAERIFRGYRRTLGEGEGLRRQEVESYLADIRARRGDLAGAERELTAALDALDAWRAGLGDQALRLFAFQASATDESDGNATVARVIAALAAGGRVGAAFALAERRRARELGDRLLAAAALDGPAPVSVRRAADGRAPDHPRRAGGAAPRQHRARRVCHRHPGARRRRRSSSVAARRPRPASCRRPTRWPGSIGRLLALVARRGDIVPEADALGRALLGPILPLLGPRVTRIVVVPDGPLHRVPWDALRLEDGRYVVERFAVGLAPSAGALAVLRRHPRPRPTAAEDAPPPGHGRPRLRSGRARGRGAVRGAGWSPAPARLRAPRRGSSRATHRSPTCGWASARARRTCAGRHSPASG